MKISTLLIFLICCMLFSTVLSGCIEEDQIQEEQVKKPVYLEQIDSPALLPNWKDGNYHDYYGTSRILREFNERDPNLVYLFSIGKSVLNRDIWCIRITNEKAGNSKLSCLIDGCIHGSEWESGEACLYFAEYLLINFNENKTITSLLNKTEVYIVPLLNPDGRQEDVRHNENGIDLNRNFDAHFGRLRGKNYRLGKLLGFIKIPQIRTPRQGTFTNCGRHPFSEPETQAIRDLMKTLNYRDFSFYVNCHTAVHTFAGPSNVDHKPEFKLTFNERRIINVVLDWVVRNTEYGAFRWGIKNYFGNGNAFDWCFKEFHIPSFIFEILSLEYEPGYGKSKGKHDHLVHWMKTTLPVFMYLLVNIENLHQWRTPDIQPSLPEGIPPPPLK